MLMEGSVEKPSLGALCFRGVFFLVLRCTAGLMSRCVELSRVANEGTANGLLLSCSLKNVIKYTVPQLDAGFFNFLLLPFVFPVTSFVLRFQSF